MVDDFLFRFGNPPIGIRPTTFWLRALRCGVAAWARVG
jgi:hypothetical protein